MGEATKSVTVRGVGGEAARIDLSGIAGVVALRARAGEVFGLAPYRLKLCIAGRVIEDGEPLSDLCREGKEDEEITVVAQSFGPEWYPQDKYMHEGKDVLRIEYGIGPGRFPVQTVFIHYTDGSVDDGHNQYDACEWGPDAAEARALIENFGFVQRGRSHYGGERGTVREYVPLEHPEIQ